MRKHWYLLFEEKDYRVDKGVLHCWIREGSDSSWGGGSYYPNFGKWKSMVDAKEPPFDNPEVTAGWRSDEGGSEQFLLILPNILNRYLTRLWNVWMLTIRFCVMRM